MYNEAEVYDLGAAEDQEIDENDAWCVACAAFEGRLCCNLPLTPQVLLPWHTRHQQPANRRPPERNSTVEVGERKAWTPLQGGYQRVF